LPYLGRINALCPVCGSLERNRLIYEFMKDINFIENKDTRLLHVAPEKCFYRVFSKKLNGNYTPADKFEPGYRYPSGTVPMDITNIGFPDESFDRLVCIHVLEHVNDDGKALSELYRVLKKGGIAIINVPFEKEREHTYEDPSITDPLERRKHFGQADHVRIYGKDFIERFVKPGFKIEFADYADKMDNALRKKLVVKDEEVFLLKK
jgi:SAM-dependent methyltransferase